MASQRMNNHAVEVVFLFVMLAAFSGSVVGQNATASLAERLGYSRDAKLLIVHADDLGMTHAVNAASIQGLESGLVSSASMMVHGFRRLRTMREIIRMRTWACISH
jgi:hypothetical protein